MTIAELRKGLELLQKEHAVGDDAQVTVVLEKTPQEAFGIDRVSAIDLGEGKIGPFLAVRNCPEDPKFRGLFDNQDGFWDGSITHRGADGAISHTEWPNALKATHRLYPVGKDDE